MDKFKLIQKSIQMRLLVSGSSMYHQWHMLQSMLYNNTPNKAIYITGAIQYVSQDVWYILQSDSFFLHASFSFSWQVHSCMMVHHKWISHSTPLHHNADLWVFWLTGCSSLRSSSCIQKSQWHLCTLWVAKQKEINDIRRAGMMT